jgi:excisionase family DNA binding protein
MRFLTLAEAAPLVGLHPGHLRRLCALGTIEGAQLKGKTWLLPGRQLAGFIRRRDPGGRGRIGFSDGSWIVERPDIEAEYGLDEGDEGVFELYLAGDEYAGTYGSWGLANDARLRLLGDYTGDRLSQPPAGGS